MEWDEWLCGEHATQAVIEAEEYEDWRTTLVETLPVDGHFDVLNFDVLNEDLEYFKKKLEQAMVVKYAPPSS